jgi:hypothetical protein
MIYLASPYSHPDLMKRIERFEEALNATMKLMNDGYVVFSPVVHSHPLSMKFSIPGGWDYWKLYDEHFLRLCSQVYVLKISGWVESVGVQAEIELARQLRRPISYISLYPWRISSC